MKSFFIAFNYLKRIKQNINLLANLTFLKINKIRIRFILLFKKGNNYITGNNLIFKKSIS